MEEDIQIEKAEGIEKPKKTSPICNFCGRYQHETGYIITGPDVNVCSDCVALMVDIIREKEFNFCCGSGKCDKSEKCNNIFEIGFTKFCKENETSTHHIAQIIDHTYHDAVKRLNDLSNSWVLSDFCLLKSFEVCPSVLNLFPVKKETFDALQKVAQMLFR